MILLGFLRSVFALFSPLNCNFAQQKIPQDEK